MPKKQGEHHLTQEPQIKLGLCGDPFSICYDYDQTRDGKLTRLTALEKALWMQARTDFVFLAPLRKILNEESDIFKKLMTVSGQTDNCLFSIAVMGVMLNGIESFGGFLKPEATRDNHGRFSAFLGRYMSRWSNMGDVLWKNYRNGIAHGFQIGGPNGIEFLKGNRVELHDSHRYVCPIHFFKDLEQAIGEYFKSLNEDEKLLKKFLTTFDRVYPN